MGSILVGCSITSRNKKMLHKIHVKVGKEEGLKLDNSFIMTEHIRSVDKIRFFINNNYPIKVGELSCQKLKMVEEAIMFELGFGSNNRLRI
jgi:mRNA-degrading endonuclease toxin of MazEF toxin-antitoxin module